MVAKALGVHEAASDVMLVRQGESGDTFYVLLEGEAKVVRNGRKIATLGPGTWFGELALLDPAPRRRCRDRRTVDGRDARREELQAARRRAAEHDVAPARRARPAGARGRPQEHRPALAPRRAGQGLAWMVTVEPSSTRGPDAGLCFQTLPWLSGGTGSGCTSTTRSGTSPAARIAGHRLVGREPEDAGHRHRPGPAVRHRQGDGAARTHLAPGGWVLGDHVVRRVAPARRLHDLTR